MLSSRMRGTPAATRGLDLLERGALDLDRHALRSARASAQPRGLPHAAGQRRVVLLDEDRVVEPAAMAHPAAGPHGLLLELAQARRGLARVEDARARALDGLHVARGERGHAGQAARGS